MAWLRFTADFDWSPRHGSTIAYKTGMVLNVTRRCADKAVGLKRAVRMRKDNRNSPPVDVSEIHSGAWGSPGDTPDRGAVRVLCLQDLPSVEVRHGRA